MRTTEETGQLLSRRELETLHHISQGRTYHQTAKIMGISPNTVDTYVRRIRSKHRAVGHGELVRLGILLDLAKTQGRGKVG